MTDDRGREIVRVANASGGQTEITWAKHPVGDPATVESERVRIVSAIETLKTLRRTLRVNHAKARERFEARGLAAMAERSTPHAAPTHVVRIYYVSQGDELLCFDAGPMSLRAAATLASETDRDSGVRRGMHGQRDVVAEVIDTRKGPIKPPKGARLVVLPSQMHERGEVASVATADSEAA